MKTWHKIAIGAGIIGVVYYFMRDKNDPSVRGVKKGSGFS